ncbi:MAG: DNA double-strand break repair nuclease NurA [Candidatus Nanohaloarchaea archaeon]|nr:DNA double-strand break repair nuclease NurA [Candidatus Nanohaloarchaea archaeon]
MPSVEDVVKSIKKLENRRKEVGADLKELREENLESEVVVEPDFVVETRPADLDHDSIAGVDGGLIKKEFHGVDVVLTRAVSALFNYRDGRLDSSEYLPGKSPEPEVTHLESPLDRRQFNLSTSLLRLKKEVKTALEAVKNDVDLVLMDGSIVPQYTDRPTKGSEAREMYDQLIEMYQRLFQEALDRNVLLAGVIEDSRGTSMSELLAEQGFIDRESADILNRSQDTNILHYVLEKGERTCVMKYTKEYENHHTLNDIGEDSKKIHNFYLRTVENGSPIRIDFLNNGEISDTADRIASMIMPICSYSSMYGIPSVIVEADQRAKLSEQDIERFSSRLKSVVGPLAGVQELRRETRPF